MSAHEHSHVTQKWRVAIKLNENFQEYSHSFLKRNVNIDDIGNSALYLLSDLAGGVTGEIHYVDAGYNKVGMPDPKNM